MTSFLTRTSKPALAYNHHKPDKQSSRPAIVFCGGYRSDMTGTKATFLENKCKELDIEYLRFDYTGHGQSEGVFDTCILSDWIQDTQDIINAAVTGKYVLVGSSMGGWISLCHAINNQNNGNIHAIIGIAAAPDFTEDLFELRLSHDQQKKLFETGIAYVENDYSDEPYAFTKEFYEDGKQNLILRKTQNINSPIYLIQGRNDLDVPCKTAYKIQEIFNIEDNQITIIEDGDHRLSSPSQLDITWGIIQNALENKIT